ncbi:MULTISPECIES: clamp-binding protein CrfC [Escherichia]|uniref:clamp-binding protein CrfC n=1 Tax=Escherichia TaxID=561 RepID=UPI000CF75458|nr:MULTISPECIES: clamp-binding protein CrfC [Escherichia]MEC9498044.1 clamp-binding protein CrfC [Escherichia whittamii]MEC9558529.1 clamp-binding protein CrfC [Escherichia whittamii]QLX42859.1 clamp-binding protein CrfC [Escherichia coli]
MCTQTIYELSQEAERLLLLSRQQLQLLEKMPLTVPGEDAPPLTLPWSQHNIVERHVMLNNELRKISRLEMVLAIVGTMKAGKSTTINAIVGTEVLPNRNRPMTALPTLIRHTPGQKEPVLHFSHVSPVDCLIQQLQQRLRDYDIKHLADLLEIDKDMRALMQRIENGVAFEKYYQGAQPIFHCLKSLNDLVRLAKALDVDFPFSAYAAIEHIPVIEVEFVHLAGLESYPGQLTLLDTPGPNEAGQPHLQKMLKEQLARASAVLAVMDYTQLKSISDEEVRAAVMAVGKSVPLYVLVNKFDQQDRNSDDAEQVRALISGTLMKGCVTPGQIFPVSSMWGYLANRARHELASSGRLPDPQQQRWVEDFAHAALGRRWRNADLEDIDHIRHAVEQLWEDSLFEQPVQALLHAAYANASLYALRSASHKLLNYAQQAREYLDFRAHGLTVACEQLRQNIHQLEENLQLLQLNQAQVSGEIQHEIELALASANDFLRQQQDEVNAQLAALFQHDSWPLSEIRTRCETLLQTAQTKISRDFTLRFAELESTLCRVLTDVIRPIEQRVKVALSESGFRPGFDFPVFRSAVPHFNTRQLFNDAISPQEMPDEQVTRLGVVRETFSRWLNQPDWGQSNEKSTKKAVDYSVLQRTLTEEFDLYCQQMAKVLAVQVDDSVTAGMSTFFADFAVCLTELHTRLRESLALRQQNESVVKIMQQQLQQAATTHGWIYTDSQLLRDDIQTLFTAEQY